MFFRENWGMFRECSDKNLNNLHRKYRFSDFLSEPPNPEPPNPKPPNPKPPNPEPPNL